MNILIDGLSCTNLSGRQVLCGLLTELLRGTEQERFILLLHPGNRDVVELMEEAYGLEMPKRLVVVFAPAWTAHWFGRALYERWNLRRRIARFDVDVCLTLSGGWIPGWPCRQVTLALNPWALVHTGRRSPAQCMKAALQRRTYRKAVQYADGIGYGSGYMQRIYRTNANAVERSGAIVYPALSDRDITEMERIKQQALPRDRYTILCVSLMTSHKDIGTLLDALHMLREQYSIPASLRLVGGWSDERYRTAVEQQIERLGLNAAVRIEGHLPRLDLLRAYRSARVYGLLSRSESFGIPAVEAQRMGAPVVAALGCAAPEVCGAGGRYVEPGAATAAAAELRRLLTDDAAWQTLSDASETNARGFEYAVTTRPLFSLLGLPLPEREAQKR